jgi:hypothetical protein
MGVPASVVRWAASMSDNRREFVGWPKIARLTREAVQHFEMSDADVRKTIQTWVKERCYDPKP